MSDKKGRAMKKINEQVLEDWICEHPETLPYHTQGDMVIVGRQVQLPHGIADILAWDYLTYVMELKVGHLQDKDVGQVLRYAYDVRKDLNAVVFDELENREESLILSQRYIWKNKGFHFGVDSDWGISGIRPVLVGQGADDKILAAAETAGIDIVFWTLEGSTFSFQRIYPRLMTAFHDTSWVRQIQALVAPIILEKAEQEFDDELSALFGAEVHYEDIG